MKVRRVAAALVVTLAAAGCMHSAGADVGGRAATATTVAQSAQNLEQTFARAGIATVADETSAKPLVPVSGIQVLTLTRWQVENIGAEAADQGGILGSDLDTMLRMPATSPQLADIVGGWVVAKADPIAAAAAPLLGSPDWTHPEQVILPTAVTTLFAADLLQHVALPGGTESATPSASGADSSYRTAGGPGTGALVVEDASIVRSPCTTVAGFVDRVLDQVFAVLHLDPAGVAAFVNGALGGGLVGAILGGLAAFLASFWNAAVHLAEQALKAVISQITKPILLALADAIGGVALFTMLRSYLKQWAATVTPTPASNQFAIAPKFNTGQFTVSIDRNAEVSDWPPQLVDCAEAVHVPLPTIATTGAPVQWTVTGQEPGLVTIGAVDGALDTNLRHLLDYRTGSESAHVASTGIEVRPTVTASVRVRRPEIEQLRKFVTAYLTAQVPDLVAPYVNPILASFIEDATKFLDTITAVVGQRTIVVAHHVPKPVPGCTAQGNVIPAGNYAGPVRANLAMAFASGVPARGGGTYETTGSISLHSDGAHVTGEIQLSGTGAAHAGLAPVMEMFDHSVGNLHARITGTASQPTVVGRLAGQDEVVGHTSHPFRAGLHVTEADCGAVSGDLIAMWDDIMQPVRKYLTLRGSGDWTIPRTS